MENNNYTEERKKDNKKRNLILLLFLVVILVVSTGYATLSTLFGINSSNVTFNKATWKILFTSVDDQKVDNITPTSRATISDDKKEINFSLNLSDIGDKYTFDAVISNQSSHNAVLSSAPTLVVKKGTQTVSLPGYFKYSVVDSNGSALTSDFRVNAGDSKTITVSVEYQDSTDLPDENQTYIEAQDGNDIVL